MVASLKEALKGVGINQADAEFDVAIAKYLNSGGTIMGACDRLNAAAARMPGMGQVRDAGNGQKMFAQTRQPLEDGEASCRAPGGHIRPAPSSSSNHDERGHPEAASDVLSRHAPSRRVPDRGGEGHGASVQSNQGRLAIPAATPSRTERGLSSIKLVQPAIQKGLLQLRKTADGRAWASIRWHELYGMRNDGGIADLILKRANAPKDKSAELITILSNKQFGEIIDAAQKQISPV